MKRKNLWKRTLACVLGVSMALGNTGGLLTAFAEEAETVSVVSADEAADEAAVVEEPAAAAVTDEAADETAILDEADEPVVIADEVVDAADESTAAEEAAVSSEDTGLVIEDIETVENPGIAVVSEEGIATASVDTSAVAGSLSVGGSVTATINEDNDMVYYQVTPTESDGYSFYSVSDYDTVAYLYDADGNEMFYSDDNDTDSNFELNGYLSAGETYYLGVKFYSNRGAGSFTVYMAEYAYLTARSKESFVYAVTGDTVTLSVLASSNAGTITYQWSYYEYDEEEDEYGYVTMSGETSANLTISNVTGSADIEYRCDVTDGDSTISVYVYLYVYDELYLNYTYYSEVTAGGSVTLSVEALSPNAIESYTWYYYDAETDEYVQISGASSSEYLLENVTSSKNYQCEVSDGESKEYAYFYVAVETDLSASGDFNYVVALEVGGSETLTVTAASSYGTITYQWYKDGEAIDGATTVSLTVTETGYYDCVVRDDYSYVYVEAYVYVDSGFSARAASSWMYITSGSSATLSVIASTESGALSYEWYKWNSEDGVYDSVGTDSPVLVTGALTSNVDDYYDYYCKVSDGYNTSNIWFGVYISSLTCSHEYLYHYAAVEATSTSTGNIEYWVCEDCGMVFTDANATTEATDGVVAGSGTGTHTHSYGEWTVTKAATCTEAGEQYRVCSCGEKETKTIPATGHSFGAWTTQSEATVFAAEVQVHTCSVCGATESQTVGNPLTPTISVNATSIKLKKKQSTSKVVVSGLANGDYVTSWKSSNTKIVTVNSKGKITAKNKTGTATITITLASGLTQKIKVKVQKKAVKTTKITGVASKITLSKGKTLTLTPVLLPIASVQKITYSSSNKKVATVNSKGKITAKKKGTATITIKSGSKKFKCKVTVK